MSPAPAMVRGNNKTPAVPGPDATNPLSCAKSTFKSSQSFIFAAWLALEAHHSAIIDIFAAKRIHLKSGHWQGKSASTVMKITFSTGLVHKLTPIG